MSFRSLLAFLAVLALVGLLGFGLASKGGGDPEVGEPLPVADLPVLTGEGTSSLESYRGRWVLVNVWASWCGPCRNESPALQGFFGRNRRSVVVLGIDTRDLREDGRDFLEDFEISYPQLRDADGDYADELGTTGVPESFLVDPRGDLVAHYPGPFRDEEAIAAFAAPALRAAS